MWASREVAAAAVAHTVFEPARGWDKPSDHVPIMTSFAL
jgi:exodeoxyribonuclease-3